MPDWGNTDLDIAYIEVDEAVATDAGNPGQDSPDNGVKDLQRTDLQSTDIQSTDIQSITDTDTNQDAPRELPDTTTQQDDSDNETQDSLPYTDTQDIAPDLSDQGDSTDGLSLDTVETGCVPDCESKDCGYDGCGGSCGSCPSHYHCKENACVYNPWCGDGNCDSDLFEHCGNCPLDCGCGGNDVCYLTKCCTPLDCVKEGYACGQWNDACGGQMDCGTCSDFPNSFCNDLGECDCADQCWFLECGPGGCGESCGECPDHYSCQGGYCVFQPWCGDGICSQTSGEDCAACPSDCVCPQDAVCYEGACCTPKGCDSSGVECGDWDDGCGSTISCGKCLDYANSFCDDMGYCDCAPDCKGKECGDDGCASTCGACGPGLTCFEYQCIQAG